MSSTDSAKVKFGMAASYTQSKQTTPSTGAQNATPSFTIRVIQGSNSNKSNQGSIRVNFAVRSKQNAYRQINKKFGEG